MQESLHTKSQPKVEKIVNITFASKMIQIAIKPSHTLEQLKAKVNQVYLTLIALHNIQCNWPAPHF
jgi:hypothetical protein